MKKIIILIVTFYSLPALAQNIAKVYYDVAKTKIKFAYQTNANHVKNGSYKAYSKDGTLAEEGIYKVGKKNGTWKQYDNYGKPFSVINYVDDKIHGVYKQWCFEDGKTVSYLCGDYLYNMGKEEKAIQYWPNGNKSKNIAPNGVCNEWYENGNKKSEWTNKNCVSGGTTYFLENGKPEVEIINGKTYKYYDNSFSDAVGTLRSISYLENGYFIKCSFNFNENGNYIHEITQNYSDSLMNAKRSGLEFTGDSFKVHDNYAKLYNDVLLWEFNADGSVYKIKKTENGEKYYPLSFSTMEEQKNDTQVLRGIELYEKNSKK